MRRASGRAGSETAAAFLASSRRPTREVVSPKNEADFPDLAARCQAMNRSVTRLHAVSGTALLVLMACDPVASASGVPATAATPRSATAAERTPADPVAAPSPEAPAAEPARVQSAPEPVCTQPCEPRPLATARHPKNIQLDASHVYYLAESKVHAVPREGGPDRVLASDVFEIAAVSDTHVFACRRTKAIRPHLVAIPTSPGAEIVLARTDGCRAALLGQTLMFAGRDDALDTWVGRIPAPTRGDTAPKTVDKIVALKGSIEDLATDGRHVYWMTQDTIHRLDPKTGTTTVLAPAPRSKRFTLTATHVVWADYANINRVPKTGGGAEVVASFADALDLASDGTHVYWASNRDEAWFRLDPADKTLATYAVADGSPSIAVDGTDVFWSRWGASGSASGGIVALQTCACGEDSLPTRPAIRTPVGPARQDIDTFRWGYTEEDNLLVQIGDLSSDEASSIEMLAAAHTEAIPPGTDGLPTRFPLGRRYRAATRDGVFEVEVSGYSTGMAGEGTHFYVEMAAKGIRGSALVVDAKRGPNLGKIRRAKHDGTLVPAYLPALQQALGEAKIRGTRKLVLAPRNVEIASGAFPAPQAVIIAVSADDPGGGGDHDSDVNRISALVLGDASGTISRVIYGFDRRLEEFSIDDLVDIAEDGIDEVIFGSHYYEGAYILLVHWRGDKPLTTPLGGDGA